MDKAYQPPSPEHLPPDAMRELIFALDAAAMGIVVIDPNRPETPVTYANPEFFALTGYERDEIIGRNLRLLQGPDTDPLAVAALGEAIAAAREICLEMLGYRKGGATFWMRADLRPVLDAQGHPLRFVGVLTDVSQQRQSRAALQESEERLRAVTAAIPLPLLTVRMDGTIVRANAAAREVLGVDGADNLVGHRIEDFRWPGDEGAERLCDDIHQRGAVERMEARARRQDGTPLWVLASARTFVSRGEQRYLLILQDVTELKRKERELTEANEEAERNIRARMRFLAAASHDLRQPLQALALFASALDHHVETAQARNIVNSIKTALRGMEEMFDSLLDMSKLDAGVMKADLQVFLVNDVLEQIEVTYGPQAAAAGLELRVVASSAAVHSDPRLLTRIIGNFVSNAIRYTRRGRVLVGCRHHGETLRIAVCDTGPGIPENQRLEIFREFRRGTGPTPTGRDAGTGLGLAIVQRMARLLGHRVDVRSTMGKGSTFIVELPLAEEGPSLAEEDEEAADMRDLGGATVVVLDDDRDIQEGLDLLLREWGCTPVVADGAEAAAAALSAARLTPELVLADLHLGEAKGGLAAIDLLRRLTGASPSVLLFTGDTAAAATAHMGDRSLPVLRKPIDPVRLRILMADALGR